MAEDNINDNIEKFSKDASSAASRIDTLKDKLGELNQASQTVGSGFDGFLFSANALTKTLENNKDALEKIKSGQMGANEASKLQVKLAKQTADLQGRKEQLQKKLLGGTSKLTDAQKFEAKASLAGINSKIKASQGLGKELEKATGGGTKFGAAMFKSKGIFSKITGDTKKSNKAIGNFSKSFASMGKKGGAGFIATLMKGVKLMKLMRSLNPLGAIAGILMAVVKGMIKANNVAADLGRQMGLTAGDAGLVRSYFIDISNATKDILDRDQRFILPDEVQAANQALNKLLGTQATFHNEILSTTAEEAKFLGMSLETSAKLGQRAMFLNKTRKSITDSVIEATHAAREELGVRLDFRDVLQQVAEVSGRIRAVFADNTKELAFTLQRAKSLGMALGDVAGNSRKLLNFEQSINAELEAELFLRRDLNLDQARLAAMTQDYDTYMKEITKNAGDFFEFSKMNVFQQDKLAAALGMSADQLSDMLYTQVGFAELQQQITNASTEEERNRAMQLSLQQRFNQEMEKLQVIFINIMEKLTAKLSSGKMPRLLRWLTGAKKGEGADLLDTEDIYGVDIDTTKTLDNVDELQMVGGVNDIITQQTNTANALNMSLDELNTLLKNQQNVNVNVNNSMDYDGFNAGPATTTSIDRTSYRYNTTFYGPKY